ncbi:acetyl-CoA synthetase-like protein [Parathielavia appendiculata]|uniref:Acetyl-CoA synthetase-like protein n=1 Tax=Parathielavia appendiculata TaxID=2587402 RepID=A0AAN6U728_9PEZI|nr:acetyl-CoA synthetase-like protein [Parathielavia appendiculata]
MAFLATLLLRLDESVTGLFGQWNPWTSVIVTVLVGFLTYQIAARQEPDIHPLLLARQSQRSEVRLPGESPVYRSQSAPHGMPLNAGLNVKDPGAAKWSRGRDGDLRDIWRQVIAGVQEDGPTKGATGRILTVLGTDKVVEHHLRDLTRHINFIGQHLASQGATRVAIYLPNSVELMVTLFACAFYNLTAVVLPFDQPDDAVISMLRRSDADIVVTAPGSFPFNLVVQNYPSLRQLIWVVDEGSKHMDWNEIPQGAGGSVNVTTWQDVLYEGSANSGNELPPLQGQREPSDVIVFWQSKPGQEEEMVQFTSSNLIAGVAGQIFAIPTSHRMGPSDLFLPADSLANTHTLVLTLAALYSNASVAFNSAAPQAEDLTVAVRGVFPTILVATPAALLKTHKEAQAQLKSSLVARTLHSLQLQKLTQNGVMPLIKTRLPAGSKLRLILTAERPRADTPRLSCRVLTDLRAFTGARIMYALTAPKVAGTVTQTGFYDYRVFDGEKDGGYHFGPPLTNAEIVLRDTGLFRTGSHGSRGEIFVRGPCVAGGEASVAAAGMFRDDNTLAYTRAYEFSFHQAPPDERFKQIEDDKDANSD